jgi:hypothetical protein
MREGSQLGDVGRNALFAKDSRERLPVKGFHVIARAVSERLVRSDDGARGFLYRRHRSGGGASAAAPSSVIQEDDPPPIVEDSLVERRHRQASSVSIVDVHEREQSRHGSHALSIPHAGPVGRLG